jgi:nitrite reductase/ring-hydroxylating ferredoxin subunit
MANIGYLLLSAGAYLGGDEVYDIGYGVNHTAFQHGPGSFTQVMPEADVPENGLTKGQAGDVSILLTRINGRVYALDDTCVHAGCSLAGGSLDGLVVTCPCHGSQYDVRDGRVVNGPATMNEPSYDVQIVDGMVEVKQR